MFASRNVTGGRRGERIGWCASGKRELNPAWVPAKIYFGTLRRAVRIIDS